MRQGGRADKCIEGGCIINSGEEDEGLNLEALTLKYLKEMEAEHLRQGGEVIQRSKLFCNPSS